MLSHALKNYEYSFPYAIQNCGFIYDAKFLFWKKQISWQIYKRVLRFLHLHDREPR